MPPLPTNTPADTPTHTPTSTPYLQLTATPAPTNTPGGPTDTPTPQATQWIWTGGPTPPEPGQPGNNPGAMDCNHPESPLAVVGWMDYERCLAQAAISIQPYHMETLNAIPTMFADREPIITISEVKSGLATSAAMVQQTLSASTPFAQGTFSYDPYSGQDGCNLMDGCIPEFGPGLIPDYDPLKRPARR